jgi:hypothetical protein
VATLVKPDGASAMAGNALFDRYGIAPVRDINHNLQKVNRLM